MPSNVGNSENSPFQWKSIPEKIGQAAKAFGRKVAGFMGKPKDVADKISSKAKPIFKSNPERVRDKKLMEKARKEKSSGRKILGFTLPGTRAKLTEGQKADLRVAAFELFPRSVPKTKENQKIWDRIITINKWDNKNSSFAEQMVEKYGIGGEGDFYYSASQTKELERHFPDEAERKVAKLLLLEKAAEEGSDLAQIQIGGYYALRDPAKAEKYLKLAGEKNIKGEIPLGDFYVQLGNINEALESYQNAKERILNRLDNKLLKLDRANEKAKATLTDLDRNAAIDRLAEAETIFNLYEEVSTKMVRTKESSSSTGLQEQFEEMIDTATNMQRRYSKSHPRWDELQGKIAFYQSKLDALD